LTTVEKKNKLGVNVNGPMTDKDCQREVEERDTCATVDCANKKVRTKKTETAKQKKSTANKHSSRPGKSNDMPKPAKYWEKNITTE